MGRDRKRSSILGAVVTTAAVGIALFAPGAVPTAAADACSEHGNTLPENLSIEQAQKAVRCLINKERGPNLDRDRRLARAAQYHSRYMRDHTCFSHRCAGEKSTEGRLRKFNYITGGLSFWLYAENLGWGLVGDGTPREMVQSWMRSPAHRANMLNTRFRDIGVGFAHGSPTNRNAPGGLYTVDFGIRRR